MKIDTKMNLTDEVYYMKDNKILKSIITGVLVEKYLEVTHNKTNYYLKDESNKFDTGKLFLTKEELIKSL